MHTCTHIQDSRVEKQKLSNHMKILIDQLKKELRVRGCYEFGKTKKDLKDSLKGILTGVQRFPSLLLTNPIQPLDDLNIQNYTIFVMI